jgi:hypothetical protein
MLVEPMEAVGGPVIRTRFRDEQVCSLESGEHAVATLPYRPMDVVLAEGNKYNFKPCPFLVNSRCSVYEDRPLVCRVHHSLSDTALDCNPFVSSGRPPMYNPDVVEVPYRVINAAVNPMEPSGNIAEFFPVETDAT